MTKVFIGDKSTNKNDLRNKSFVLDTLEMKEFESYVNGLKERCFDSMYDEDDVNIQSILDDIDCDRSIKSIFLGLDQDYEFMQAHLSEIERVRSKIQELREKTIKEKVDMTSKVPNVRQINFTS